MILATVMRNSVNYLERFFAQVEELNPRLIVIVEGDSTDDTYAHLQAWKVTSAPPTLLLKVEHGGPTFPSIIHPQRWRQLSVACNAALTAAVRELEEDEPLIYVESDLIWTAETMKELASRTTVFPAVAPMSMYDGRFYDTWGHTHNWEGFAPHAPYFPGYQPNQMHQITSAGSCIAFSWTAAQAVHFSPIDCIRGIGRTLADDGLTLWLDPTLEVLHP